MISLFSLFIERLPSPDMNVVSDSFHSIELGLPHLHLFSSQSEWLAPYCLAFTSHPTASVLAGNLLSLHPGRLLPSDLWAWVFVMAECVAVTGFLGRGFMPAVSCVPVQHATPPGLVSGEPTVFSSPCHTLQLVLVMVSDFPSGNFACLPCPGNTMTVPPGT